MNQGYLVSSDINQLYRKLKEFCSTDEVSRNILIVCINNYDGQSLPTDCARQEEIIEKLEDLLDKAGGKYFRFNHGSKIFSGDIFLKKGERYKSQFDRAIELINLGHKTKAVMQVILPDMIQGEDIFPIPAVISVVLKSRTVNKDNYLDIVGIYRHQEFSTWWPLNVLELSRIKNMAIEELRKSTTEKYISGDIITIAIQGHWDENVALGNKSSLDDKSLAEEYKKDLIIAFTPILNVNSRKEAINRLVIALEEKKKTTSYSSYDPYGLELLTGILKDKIFEMNEMLAQDGRTTYEVNYSIPKEYAEKTLHSIEKIVKKLRECTKLYRNVYRQDMEDNWKECMHNLFDEAINNLKELNGRL